MGDRRSGASSSANLSGGGGTGLGGARISLLTCVAAAFACFALQWMFVQTTAYLFGLFVSQHPSSAGMRAIQPTLLSIFLILEPHVFTTLTACLCIRTFQSISHSANICLEGAGDSSGAEYSQRAQYSTR
jgi:hypothetical protein